MKTFYYYSGDWTKGFTLLLCIEANKLTDADTLFKSKMGYDPKNTGISVTLQPK